jgi:8-oxo-dGTP diphosphatase
MKKKKNKTRRQRIEAAGGIVMRGRVRPLFAVVQLRRQKTWVLPKGKLNRGETALAAARREAIEETGHDVEVHEFLGSLAYKSAGRPKIVRFWRMQASGRPVAKLMRDVRAVRWLSLAQAIARLTHEREKEFLEKAGRQAMREIAPSKRSKPKPAAPRRKSATGARKRVVTGPGVRAEAERMTRVPQRGGEAGAPGPAPAVPTSFDQIGGRKPPAAVRKLWALLRRQPFRGAFK